LRTAPVLLQFLVGHAEQMLETQGRAVP